MVTLCKRIVESSWFQWQIIFLIVLAAVLVGLETDADIKAAYGDLIDVLDRIVIWAFVVEAALKMLAHGRHFYRYFRDPWNVFDFTIVVLCFLPATAEFAAVIRLARILRVIRLVSVLPRLQTLVGTLLRTIPSMGSVSLILLLLFYIYAVIGVHLWGKFDPDNFGTLPRSMITLFKVLTLEDWPDYFDPQMQVREADGLAIAPAYISAPLYFFSFIIIGTMVMLNLVIGVILKSMEETELEEARKERAKHLKETGQTSIVDDLRGLDAKLDELRMQIHLLLARAKAELPAEPKTPSPPPPQAESAPPSDEPPSQ